MQSAEHELPAANTSTGCDFTTVRAPLDTMMTLRGFCLVLTTVILAHFAQAGAASADRSSVSFVIGYCVAFSLLGKLCAVAATLRYSVASSSNAWSHFELRRTLVEWLWVGSLPWAMAASGWMGSLGYLDSHGWPHAMVLMLWFAPSVVFLLALDLSAAQLEQYLCDDVPRMRPASANPWRHAESSLTRRWSSRVRLGGTGAVIMCLVPVLMVVAAIDGLNHWAPTLSTGMRALIALGILSGVCLLLSPVWMRAWMGAHAFPADAATPARVADFCRKLRIHLPSVLCISGNQAWHGAALVGWAPPARQLWIGASVVRELPSEELDMVILHELAHLRRGHCWWRAAALLLCGGVILWAMTGSWTGLDQSMQAGLEWHLWGERSWLLVLGVMILATLSWTSRSCELDADREACLQASRLCEWAAERPDRAAAALVSALARMHGAEVDARRWYWLHPSLSRRKEALLARFQTAQSPAVSEK